MAISFRPISFQFASKPSDALGAGFCAGFFFGVPCVRAGMAKILAARTTANKRAVFIEPIFLVIWRLRILAQLVQQKNNNLKEVDVR
jgi:hypothetical protein